MPRLFQQTPNFILFSYQATPKKVEDDLVLLPNANAQFDI